MSEQPQEARSAAWTPGTAYKALQQHVGRCHESPPSFDFAALEDEMARRCPDCHDKLHLLIETRQGPVWVCTNVRWHGWTKVFWGSSDLRGIWLGQGQWLIEVLVDQQGIPRKTQ